VRDLRQLQVRVGLREREREREREGGLVGSSEQLHPSQPHAADQPASQTPRSYWGRRAFERHFKEWRHVNGMRALGIPNTKDFYEVTKIEDALALWKTQQSRHTGGFNPETDEELEDAQGNVYNRKTYEDLRRQGLI
jgi:hypothetical protein